MKKICLLILFSVTLFSCKPEETVMPNPYREVHYRVTGNASLVSVAYMRADNSAFSVDNCVLPFDVKIDDMMKGSIASFVVQNKNSTGSFTAFIVSGSDTLQKGSTSNAFGIVSIACSIP